MYRAYESQYNTWHKEGALQILGSKTTRGQHFSFQVMFRHDLLHIPVTALPPLYTWHHQRTKGPSQRLEKTAPSFPVWVAITHSFPYFPRLLKNTTWCPFLQAPSFMPCSFRQNTRLRKLYGDQGGEARWTHFLLKSQQNSLNLQSL